MKFAISLQTLIIVLYQTSLLNAFCIIFLYKINSFCVFLLYSLDKIFTMLLITFEDLFIFGQLYSRQHKTHQDYMLLNKLSRYLFILLFHLANNESFGNNASMMNDREKLNQIALAKEHLRKCAPFIVLKKV